MYRFFWMPFLLILIPQISLAYEEYAPRFKKIQKEFVLKKPFEKVVVSAEVDDSFKLKKIQVKYRSEMIKFFPSKKGIEFPKADLNKMEILIGHDIGAWLAREEPAAPDPDVSHFSICVPYGEYYEMRNDWVRDVLEIEVKPNNYVIIEHTQRKNEMNRKENGSCI